VRPDERPQTLPANVAEELKSLVGKVQAKLRAGQKGQAELAPELKEFDGILARHKDEKTDDVAQVLLLKAMVYAKVFENTDQALALVQQLKMDYAGTTPGRHADEIIAEIKKDAESQKIKRSLIEGAKFPDFEEKDLLGKPLSLASYRGKIVLVDFWATWCGVCVYELPNMMRAYTNYHSKGFEIIGISLDNHEQRLKTFIQGRSMPWPQFFDGQGWANKLAQKYGVAGIPASFLLDREGIIIGKDLQGAELERALGKAVAR
jgi:peroxiredoxin